jgi:hypothetical protein
MLLKRRTNPSALWRYAMVCLLAFFALTLVARSASPSWADLLDGVRGAMLGATLALMGLTAAAQRRR